MIINVGVSYVFSERYCANMDENTSESQFLPYLVIYPLPDHIADFDCNMTKTLRFLM